jgi:pyruvate,water dikinase
VEAYSIFLKRTGVIDEVRLYLKDFQAAPASMATFAEAAEALRQIAEAREMPRDMEEAIGSYYDSLCELCGVTDMAVSTRSAGTKSSPGQYETYLNVKGKRDLIRNIIRVWSSTFNARSLVSRVRSGLPLESSPIGVAILRMVNARSSGIAFTADPNTGDQSRIAIEANWGLGESVVGGMVTPDSFSLDKKTLHVLRRSLGQKTVQVAHSENGVRTVELPPDKRSAFCITDEEARRIAELGKTLEAHFSVPQDLEWAIAADLPFPENVFLLQTRAEVIKRKNATYRIVLETLKEGLQ